MDLDTSASIAILMQEAEASEFSTAIRNSPVRPISASSALEASIVIETPKAPRVDEISIFSCIAAGRK